MPPPISQFVFWGPSSMVTVFYCHWDCPEKQLPHYSYSNGHLKGWFKVCQGQWLDCFAIILLLNIRIHLPAWFFEVETRGYSGWLKAMLCITVKEARWHSGKLALSMPKAGQFTRVRIVNWLSNTTVLNQCFYRGYLGMFSFNVFSPPFSFISLTGLWSCHVLHPFPNSKSSTP